MITSSDSLDLTNKQSAYTLKLMPGDLQTDTSQTKPPRKINWKFILIGIFVVTLFIGGGVAIWLLLNRPSTQPPSKTPASTSSAQTSTPSAQKDETADWKTIR